MTTVALWLLLLLSASAAALAWGWRRQARPARAEREPEAIERLVALVLRKAVDAGADEIWIGRPDPDPTRAWTGLPPGDPEFCYDPAGIGADMLADARRRGDLDALEMWLPPDEEVAPGSLWLRTEEAWIEQVPLPRHLEGEFYDRLRDRLGVHPDEPTADRRSWFTLEDGERLKLCLAIDAHGRRIIRIGERRS